MGTEAKVWPLSALRSARANPDGSVDVDPNNPVVFTIPQFQRSLVWPESKQRALISSILRGFPFGALLLVENDEKRSVKLKDGSVVTATNYGIIDGLQRTNAIVSHLKRSLAFAGSDAVLGKEFDAFHAELQTQLSTEIDPELLTDAVVVWMHATGSPDIANGFDFDTLLNEVAGRLELQPFSQAVSTALKPKANVLLAHIASSVDIGHLQIPVLIYNGAKEYLPDIFEQINTAGTILSKYEVYAAAWVSTRVEVKNPQIRAAIARRYGVLEAEGFDVDVSTTGDEYSLFDYLHGLSQYLGEKYPSLFSSRDAARNRLSSAFPLATLMLGQPIDKMAQLDSLFPNTSGQLDVDAFEHALLEAADVVNEILAPYLAFKFISDTEALAHGELQMVSLVAAVAGHLFDHLNSFKPRGAAAKQARTKKEFKLSIPQHYIYDIVRQQWRGSLYTYAAERVWDGKDPAKIYARPVDSASFDSAFATSFAEQLAETSIRRQNITAVHRAVLKFLYSPIVSVQDQAANKFDVEHLIPVKRIQGMAVEGDPWPMGALGNLAILPMGPNRIKKEETVTEYVSRGNNPPSAPVRVLLEKLILVPFGSVAIPRKNGSDSMTRQQFETFVGANWAQMTATLKANLGL
jgi:hypothetical protein